MMRKNKSKLLITMFGLSLVLSVLIGCENVSGKRKNIVNDEYKELRVKEYSYSKRFKLGKNLKKAISQYMSYNEEYDDKSMEDKFWKEDFVHCQISSARADLDYINNLMKERKSSFITKKEAEYIHYSFTGKSIKLDPEDVKDGVRGFEVYKFSDYGLIPVERITSYKVIRENAKTVDLVAKYDCYGENSQGEKPYKKGEYRIRLEKNAYSCFDGYSIRKIKRQNVKYTAKLNKVYKVKCSYNEDIKKYTVYYSPDEIEVIKNAVVDFKGNSNLENYVQDHSGSRFEVGFKLKKYEDHIKTIKPISVKVIDE